MPFIIGCTEAKLDAALGGKARALAALGDADLPIPRWFVVSANAFADSTSPDGALDADSLEGLQPSVAVQLELKEALAELCPNGETVAVRSSAADEDGPQHSFAGQLES